MAGYSSSLRTLGGSSTRVFLGSGRPSRASPTHFVTCTLASQSGQVPIEAPARSIIDMLARIPSRLPLISAPMAPSRPREAVAPRILVNSNSVNVIMDSSRLLTNSDGDFRLWQRDAHGKERIAAVGSVTLPDSVDSRDFSVVHQRTDLQGWAEAVVSWGPASNPVATLRILSPPAANYSWCKVSFISGFEKNKG